jgi:SP family general alpha glucoside:H+ symporter-like MFS transporter
MISEDAANLGVKAIYIWAGLLVPTVVILYFFYPEVSAGRGRGASSAG